MTVAGSNTYQYDANGNMESAILNNGVTIKTFSYDFENRPVGITVNGVATQFVYDEAGARIKKIGTAGTSLYVGGLYELSAGTWTRYVMAGGTRIAALEASGSQDFYHADHLGSTRAKMDASGANNETIDYVPFGETTAPTSEAYKFTGKEKDPETSLYCYGARYYDL